MMFDENLIILEAEFTSKREIIDCLINRLFEFNYINDKNQFLEDVIQREKVGTTAIGSNIAIPHAQSIAVLKPTVAFLRNKTPILWDGELFINASNIFMFVAINGDSSSLSHLEMLKKVAQRLADKKVIEEISVCKTPEEFLRIMDV